MASLWAGVATENIYFLNKILPSVSDRQICELCYSLCIEERGEGTSVYDNSLHALNSILDA
jgi:hypothetical protein